MRDVSRQKDVTAWREGTSAQTRNLSAAVVLANQNSWAEAAQLAVMRVRLCVREEGGVWAILYQYLANPPAIVKSPGAHTQFLHG